MVPDFDPGQGRKASSDGAMFGLVIYLMVGAARMEYAHPNVQHY
jgi:hypothetical protein